MSDRPLSRGARTRQALMDHAEAAILAKGYSATSIEELIAAAGITKSGFFYHFRDKADLAMALIDRDNEASGALMARLFAEAEAAHADPLEGFLYGLARYGEAAVAAPGALPGCLITAFAYQEALLQDEHRLKVRNGVTQRRDQVRKVLGRIAEQRRPARPVDLDTLADMAVALILGGIVIDRINREPKTVPRQIALYAAFVRAVFDGPTRRAEAA